MSVCTHIIFKRNTLRTFMSSHDEFPAYLNFGQLTADLAKQAEHEK